MSDQSAEARLRECLENASEGSAIAWNAVHKALKRIVQEAFDEALAATPAKPQCTCVGYQAGDHSPQCPLSDKPSASEQFDERGCEMGIRRSDEEIARRAADKAGYAHNDPERLGFIDGYLAAIQAVRTAKQ